MGNHRPCQSSLPPQRESTSPGHGIGLVATYPLLLYSPNPPTISSETRTMTSITFADTLDRIESEYDLTTLGEDSVKLWVILPLLRRVGWNDETSEVTPEFPVRGDKGDKVDYALRVGGENRIFVEAKAGKEDLAQHEEQLEGYCNGIDVITFGVLTNGRQWWALCAPPEKCGIGRFTQFDITDEPELVESVFQQFISRGKLADARVLQDTQAEARRQLRNRRGEEAERKRMIAAWNEFASDEQAQANFVADLAEQKGPRPDDSHVLKFLSSHFDLVNPIDTSCNCRVRPESITFTVEGKQATRSGVEYWNQVLLKVCQIMQQRHPDTFINRISDIGQVWVLNSKDAPNSAYTQIGETEIWIDTGGSADSIVRRSHRVLEQFEYPRESLVIENRKCADHAI